MIQRWCIVSFKTHTQKDKSIAATDFYAQSVPQMGQASFPHSSNAPTIRGGEPADSHKYIRFNKQRALPI